MSEPYAASIGSPLVSVILCVRNGMPHVREAVESVRASAYANYELVVQDGASTDGTLDYLQSLTGFARFSLTSAPDNGMGDGFNRALQRCTRMSSVEAEIAKVALNTHETMPVSFANMLLALSSEVPGADVDRITEALAHRMGRRFFKGAVPYGGPCWPRDNQALSVFIDAVGAISTLPRCVDTFNEEHGRYVLRKIMALSAPGGTVGLLGLAYKPGTSVIDRAFAVDLADWLVGEGRNVIGWDPLAIPVVQRALGDRIQYASTPEACLRASNTAIVTIPLPEFAAVDWSAAGSTLLVDCWRCLPAAATEACGDMWPWDAGRRPASHPGLRASHREMSIS